MRRTDGTWHPAEVIHRRLIAESDTTVPVGGGATPAKVQKTEGDTSVTPDAAAPAADKGDDSGDKYEYYVHYSGFNRRLDEWVRRDRVKHADEDVRDVSQFTKISKD